MESPAGGELKLVVSLPRDMQKKLLDVPSQARGEPSADIAVGERKLLTRGTSCYILWALVGLPAGTDLSSSRRLVGVRVRVSRWFG